MFLCVPGFTFHWFYSRNEVLYKSGVGSAKVPQQTQSLVCLDSERRPGLVPNNQCPQPLLRGRLFPWQAKALVFGLAKTYRSMDFVLFILFMMEIMNSFMFVMIQSC